MKRAIASIFAAGLIAAGLTAVPAVSASAAASVSATWVSSYSSNTLSYSCTAGATHTYYSENIAYVHSGCGTRVWLHQYTDGSGASYCINPGATAYGFARAFDQLQVTSNALACDNTSFANVAWDGDWTNYNCIDGAWHTEYDPGLYYLHVSDINNHCNVRIWLHANPNGSGNSLCVNPGATLSHVNILNGIFMQFQISGNQAPCSAG